MMRYLVSLLPLLAAACADPDKPIQTSQFTPAPVPGPDMVWNGRIQCGTLPGLTTIPLNQGVQVRVTGNRASFQRQVLRADSKDQTAVTESGGGTVGPDGSVTLATSASAPNFNYTGQYKGLLRPADSSTELTGTQHWTGRTIGVADRECTITLRR